MSWMKAARYAPADAVFAWFVRRLIKKNFSGVWKLRGRDLPRDGGYIGVANHHSWWDGFIPYLLSHRAAQRQPFAIMMSDAELRRFAYFRLFGAFSIDASSVRAARASVAYAASLARAGSAVWILPDGVLRPPETPPAFTSGFVHAARDADVPIVPVAMRFVLLDKQRPEAFIAIGDAIVADRAARECAQRDVERLLRELDSTIARSDRAAFEPMLSVNPGIDERVALRAR